MKNLGIARKLLCAIQGAAAPSSQTPGSYAYETVDVQYWFTLAFTRRYSS